MFLIVDNDLLPLSYVEASVAEPWHSVCQGTRQSEHRVFLPKAGSSA